jgi:TolB-like protein/Tfp pilus assembly protein PilF
MAPEQLKGRLADERSDVWALGVVLHEMVSGRRPFLGDSAFELTSAILKEEPRPLPASVPPPLAAVIERCLAKEPAQRYQRAAEVRSAMQALQAGSEPAAWPEWRSTLVARGRPAMLAALAVVFAVVIAIVLTLDVGGVRARLPGRSAPSQRFIRMAVLPFANLSGDPEQEYLTDGLTQEMITQLGRLHPESLRVIARSSVMRYRDGDTPVDQIGRELEVDYVLEGSAQREADRVRIAAELIRVHDQTQLWAESYERELSGMLALQSEVAGDIARQVNLTVTPEQESRLTGARQVDPEVYEAYLRGMFYVSQNTPESFEKGMQHLHQAVEIDPAEPLAYAGLAQGYITLGHGGAELHDAFQRARAAAEQALRLEPDMAEAVAALAHVALYYEWDWPRAEELFERALELNPSLAMTHYHYAWYLALFDRLEEAIVEHKLARDFDPLRALHTGWLGHLYNYAGRFDEAIVEANKALELNPSFGPSFYVLRFAYSSKGMHQEAIAAALRFVEVDPQWGNTELVSAYALAGQREQALEVLARLDPSTSHPVRLALMYAALGDTEAALDAMEAAYDAHRATLPWIRVRGIGLDDLRDESRFQDLLRRMNVPL